MTTKTIWRYKQGQWAKDYEPDYAGKDWENYNDYLKRNGFIPQAFEVLGGEEDGGTPVVEVYGKDDGRGNPMEPYLICITFNESHGEEIIAEDLPSLIELLPKLVPLATHKEVVYKLNELSQMAEKAFRAWHGHPFYSVCRECDPDEYERIQEVRRRRNGR